MAPDFDAVLASARAGDEAAITRLYRDLHPRLHRYLAAREPRQADDLEAEVWLAVAERLAGFEGGEPEFRGWCFAIARRRLADHRRTAARRRTEVAPDEDLDRADPGPDPAERAADDLDGDAAAAFVVEHLSPDQAEIVLLRAVADLDVETVAEIVGKRPGTVRVAYHRGLKRLARVLGRTGVTP